MGNIKTNIIGGHNMSVRNVSYDDYGITNEQLKDLLLEIRNDEHAQEIFLSCCIKVKPELASDIYYSLTGNVSYDDLKKIKIVPLPKSDFYGYRRKALALFCSKTQKKIYDTLKGQMKVDDLKGVL